MAEFKKKLAAKKKLTDKKKSKSVKQHKNRPKKLTMFLWEGVDARGNIKKGQLEAENPTLAKAALRRTGIKVNKIKAEAKPLFGIGGGPKEKAIRPGDIAVFARQMATMMSSGVPLIEAFGLIARGNKNPRFVRLINDVRQNIESGSSFSESLEKHPRYFDSLFCNLIAAGETAGILDTILEKVALYKEKTEMVKKKVKKALFYPTAIMIVAAIVVVILLLFVIPQFESMFANFGADLPAPTQFIVDASRLLQEWWYIFFGGAVVVVYAFIYAKRKIVAFQHFLERLSLKVPVVGGILENAAIARFARTLSTMFAAGVPLVEAMDSVAGAAGNIVFSKAIIKIKEDVAVGKQLQMSMEEVGVFPPMVVQMTAIGEESGALDTMLAKVADFYESEVDNTVDSLSSLLEPMIMAVLGGIIGGIVISMYLPIFQMGQVV